MCKLERLIMSFLLYLYIEMMLINLLETF